MSARENRSVKMELLAKCSGICPDRTSMKTRRTTLLQTRDGSCCSELAEPNGGEKGGIVAREQGLNLIFLPLITGLFQALNLFAGWGKKSDSTNCHILATIYFGKNRMLNSWSFKSGDMIKTKATEIVNPCGCTHLEQVPSFAGFLNAFTSPIF
jgi:hypothetical protein